MSKHLVHQKITTFVDEDTGQIIQQEESKTIVVKVSQEAFFQTYISTLSSLFQLTSLIDMKLMIKLCCLAEYNTGIVRLASKDRKTICEEFEIKPSALSRSLKSLKDKTLISEDDGVYKISPIVFWKGDRKERAKLLAEGKMSLTINFQS